MQHRLITIITATLLCICSSNSFASDKPQHFPALEANDMQTALCNIQTYNKKLNDIVAKGELSAVDMVKVHELTYTLENAFIFLNKTLSETAEKLEEVHKASERLDMDVIKDSGKTYLSNTKLLGSSTQCE